jgi:hypothetical protein
MKHAIGIGLLIAIACLFKWWIHPNVGVAYTSGRVSRGVPLNVVVVWVLLAVSAVWGLIVGLAFVFGHRRSP